MRSGTESPVALECVQKAVCHLEQVMGADEQKMMLMENKCYLMLDLCTPKTTLKFMGVFLMVMVPCAEPQASPFLLRGPDGKTDGAQGIGLSLSYIIALLPWLLEVSLV